MRGFAQEVCNRCAKAKPSENVVCIAEAHPLSTNKKPNCKRCRKGKAVCNWGNEIPAYMARIKVVIQTLQQDKPDDRKEGVGEDAKDAIEGAQGVSSRADGDGMDSVEESVGGIIEGGVGETLKESIGGGAGVLPGSIPMYDGDLLSSTALALTTALAMRESLRKSEVRSVVARLECLRHASSEG